jgi:hypothetical protein
MSAHLPSMLVVLALLSSPLAIGALVLWSAHRGYVAAGAGREG